MTNYYKTSAVGLSLATCSKTSGDGFSELVQRCRTTNIVIIYRNSLLKNLTFYFKQFSNDFSKKSHKKMATVKKGV